MVSLKSRLDQLEKCPDGAGCCPDCGQVSGAVQTVEVRQHGRGEPTGHYYEKAGQRHPFPPDPRPLCLTCGSRIGPILVLTALYNGAGRDARSPYFP